MEKTPTSLLFSVIPLRKTKLRCVYYNIVFVVTFFLCFSISSANAAYWYVRDGASGSNNGTNWTNAWEDVTNIDWSSVSRGDTVYIADGDYGQLDLDKNDSGTGTITVRKACSSGVGDSAHGTETGWNSTYGDGVAKFTGGPGVIIRAAYVTFDGIVGSDATGHGFWIHATASGNYAMNIQNKYATGTETVITCGGSWGTRSVYQMPGVRISHVKFTCLSSPSGRIEGIAVVYNSTSAKTYLYEPTFSHLYFYRIWGNPFQTYYTYGATIEYCTADTMLKYGSSHLNLVNTGFTSNIDDCATEEVSDFVIRYNQFIDCGVNGGTCLLCVHGNRHKMYGNVFAWTERPASPVINNGIIGVRDSATDHTDSHKIYNNTFVDIRALFYSNGNNHSNHVAKNNILVHTYTSDTGVDNHSWSGYVTHDYNFYYQAGSTSETNGQTGNDDPFVTYTAHDYWNNNLHLASETNAGDSTIGSEYKRDPDGVIRGTDSCWDRGAYEYQGGAIYNIPPNASFIANPSAGQFPLTVDFTDTSSDPDGDIVWWDWDFGDGETSTEQNPTYTYTSPGDYSARLTVTDDGGLTDSVTATISVLGSQSATIYIEAESGSLDSPMAVGNDSNPKASGGSYIYAPAGSGETTNPAAEAVYDIDIPYTGSYYLWLRMYGPGTANDAIYIGFNGNFDRAYPTQWVEYEWIRIETVHGSGDFSHILSAGTNQIHIGHAEELARADIICITDDPNLIPSAGSDIEPPSPPAGLIILSR